MVVDQDGAVVSKRLCGLHRQQGIAVCWCHFAIGLLGIGQARLGLKAPQIAQIAGGYDVPFFRGADVAKQRAYIVLSGHVIAPGASMRCTGAALFKTIGKHAVAWPA